MNFHVFPGSQVLVETWILEDDAEALAHLVAIDCRIEAVQFERSAGGFEQGGKHFYCGCLSRTIRTEKGKDLSAVDLKRNVIDCGKRTEPLHEVIHSNHGAPYVIGLPTREPYTSR